MSKSNSNYLQRVEEEINDVCLWASFQKQTVVIIANLNIDRLKLNKREEKISKGRRRSQQFTLFNNGANQDNSNIMYTPRRVANQPTRPTRSEISDHNLIYGITKKKVYQHKSKIITYRDTKNIDVEQISKELKDAHWHVCDIYSTIDDQYDNWKTLLENILNSMLQLKGSEFKNI